MENAKHVKVIALTNVLIIVAFLVCGLVSSLTGNADTAQQLFSVAIGATITGVTSTAQCVRANRTPPNPPPPAS